MGSFKLGRMTLRSLFSKPATSMYPVVAPTYFEPTKGHIAIDIDGCIFCGMCQKKCPADAIRVDRDARTWTIDPFACVQCGSCVLVCPKHVLRMESSYTAPAADRSGRRTYHGPLAP